MIMRKYFYTLIILALFGATTTFFTSCSKDSVEITTIPQNENKNSNEEENPPAINDNKAGSFSVTNLATEDKLPVNDDSTDSLPVLNGDKIQFGFTSKDTYKDYEFETKYSIRIGNDETEISGSEFTVSDMEPGKYKVSMSAKVKDQDISATASFYIEVKKSTSYIIDFSLGSKGVTYKVVISEDTEVSRDPLQIEGGKDSKSPEYEADRNSKKVFIKVYLDDFLIDELERELITEYSNKISYFLPIVWKIDIKSGERTYYMNVGNAKGTKQLTNYREEEVYYSDVVWESSDTFVTTVDENGLVEAKHVGTAMITAKGKYVDATFEIKVDPLYNTYKEPLPLYGYSKDAVIVQETRTFVTANDEWVGYTGYTGDYNSRYILYYRLDEGGKVKDIVVAVGKNYEEEVKNFLAERYYALDGIYYNSEHFIIMGDLDEEFIYVLYRKLDTEESANSRAVEFTPNELKKYLNK